MTKTEIRTCRIGDKGTAKSALAPSGIVEVDGIDFSARSVGSAIDIGNLVVVTDGDIGGLVVQLYHSEISIERLPNFGQPAYNSFGDKAQAKAAREAAEREQELESWHRTARWRQLQIGVVFGLVAIWLLNPVLLVAEMGLAPQVLYGIAFFVAAFIWAVVVFRVIDHLIRQFDDEFIRLISLSTILALCGSAFGLWSIQSLGVGMGLGLTVVAAIAGAFTIPLISSFFLGDGS